MSAISLLLDNYWIVRNTNKEEYYSIKHELSDKETMRFIQEMLGWKLIHTDNLLKLEKVPAHAKSFMGIQEFSETRDYCLLCAVLIYLEDKEENSQFLLSDLIRYVETIISEYMEVDWTSFSQRKSLVRVLQFVENKGMLKVYEGDSSSYSKEATSEVLYENTGLSRYFATNFPMDISGITNWRDFEKKQMEELDDEHGTLRTNRVFRWLVTCPSMYFEDPNSSDFLYLKNKRNYIETNIEKNMGATLNITKNNASIIFIDSAPIGEVHPKNSMLSEIVLLVCHEIMEMSKDKRKLVVNQDDTIIISNSKFEDILLKLKKQYQEFYSKEFKEMTNDKYVSLIKDYMKNWLMIKEDDEQIIIYPSIAITSGKYPNYMEAKLDEQ